MMRWQIWSTFHKGSMQYFYRNHNLVTRRWTTHQSLKGESLTDGCARNAISTSASLLSKQNYCSITISSCCGRACLPPWCPIVYTVHVHVRMILRWVVLIHEYNTYIPTQVCTCVHGSGMLTFWHIPEPIYIRMYVCKASSLLMKTVPKACYLHS